MKNLLLAVLVLAFSSLCGSCSQDPAEDIFPEFEVENVTAPDGTGDEEKSKDEGEGNGG